MRAGELPGDGLACRFDAPSGASTRLFLRGGRGAQRRRCFAGVLPCNHEVCGYSRDRSQVGLALFRWRRAARQRGGHETDSTACRWASRLWVRNPVWIRRRCPSPGGSTAGPSVAGSRGRRRAGRGIRARCDFHPKGYGGESPGPHDDPSVHHQCVTGLEAAS